jgi:hypothetical protein
MLNLIETRSVDSDTKTANKQWALQPHNALRVKDAYTGNTATLVEALNLSLGHASSSDSNLLRRRIRRACRRYCEQAISWVTKLQKLHSHGKEEE